MSLYGEVHEADGVHGLQPVVPVPRLPLAHDGAGGVVEGAVHESLLVMVLHLHDDPLSGVRPAVDVVDDASQVLGLRQLFLVPKGESRDVTLTHQQVVKELDQQRLAGFLSEDPFEAPVGEGVDKFSHS